MNNKISRFTSKFCKKHSNKLPEMSHDEKIKRQKIDNDCDFCVCECFFYSGYRMPYDEECCEQCCKECSEWRKILKKRKTKFDH